MTRFDDVLGAAQDLIPSERIRLIDALWETVPVEQWPSPGDQWIGEAQRRSSEYDAGRTSASPWPEDRDRARRKAALDEDEAAAGGADCQ